MFVGFIVCFGSNTFVRHVFRPNKRRYSKLHANRHMVLDVPNKSPKPMSHNQIWRIDCTHPPEVCENEESTAVTRTILWGLSRNVYRKKYCSISLFGTKLKTNFYQQKVKVYSEWVTCPLNYPNSPLIDPDRYKYLVRICAYPRSAATELYSLG